MGILKMKVHEGGISMNYKLLIINPGSTSTKISVYENEEEIFGETLRHSSEEIGRYEHILDQKDFRTQIILKVLQDNNSNISLVVSQSVEVHNSLPRNVVRSKMRFTGQGLIPE